MEPTKNKKSVSWRTKNLMFITNCNGSDVKVHRESETVISNKRKLPDRNTTKNLYEFGEKNVFCLKKNLQQIRWH